MTLLSLCGPVYFLLCPLELELGSAYWIFLNPFLNAFDLSSGLVHPWTPCWHVVVVPKRWGTLWPKFYHKLRFSAHLQGSTISAPLTVTVNLIEEVTFIIKGNIIAKWNHLSSIKYSNCAINSMHCTTKLLFSFINWLEDSLYIISRSG